jgi:L-iditol 2-dehydrogenase
MKACVLHAIGELRYEEVPEPTPRVGEVLVRVGGCGVCGSDIPRIFTKGTYRFPTIPGHEFAGTVAALGEGVESSWIGRRVAVFPLIPCRRCAQCAAGRFELCEDYDYIGSRRDGAFAEFVAAPAWNLVPIPEGVSLEEAAMTEPAAVALHALRRGGFRAGQSVAIFGAGPIGLLCAMWGRALGASEITIADIDAKRLDFARRLGFSGAFNTASTAEREHIRAMRANCVIEATGANAALPEVLATAASLGTVVLLGNPSGDVAMQQEVYWSILRKQLTLVGTWNSAYDASNADDWHTTLEYMARGKLDVRSLITHRMNLDRLCIGIELMRDRREFSSKVMYVSNGEGTGD